MGGHKFVTLSTKSKFSGEATTNTEPLAVLYLSTYQP